MNAASTRTGSLSAMYSETSKQKCSKTIRPCIIMRELSVNCILTGEPSQTSDNAVAASKTVTSSGPRIFDATATVHPRCDNLSRKRSMRSLGRLLRISGARAMAAMSASCLVDPIVCFRRLIQALMFCLVCPILWVSKTRSPKCSGLTARSTS